jgi:flagellar biosynthesis chaperone FliJ
LHKEIERIAKLKDKEIEKLNTEIKKINNKLTDY